MKDLRDRRNKVLVMKKEYEDACENVERLEKKAYRMYREDMEKVFDGLVDKLSEVLPHMDMLKFYFGSYGKEFKCDVYYARYAPSDMPIALKWDYHVTYCRDTDDIKVETNSWSGMDVTTDEELNDIRRSLEVLEALHKVDWKDFLSNVKLPEEKKYWEGIPEKPIKTMDFDEELFNIDLEYAMKLGLLINDKNNLGYKLMHKVLKITDKQVVIQDWVNWQGETQLFQGGKEYRVSKERFKTMVGTDIFSVKKQEA